MKLFELFDAPYPTDLLRNPNDPQDYRASVRLPDDTTLVINFERTDPGKYEISFARGYSMGMTGKGDAPRIFATVIKTISKFIEQKNPVELYFVAEKEDIGDEDWHYVDSSRVNLYDKLVKRYASEYNYSVERHDEESEVMYILTRESSD